MALTKRQAKKMACTRIACYIESAQTAIDGWVGFDEKDRERPKKDILIIEEALDELWREMVRRGDGT